MLTYKDLIEIIIKREFGIVGREATLAILNHLGLDVNENGKLNSFDENRGMEYLDRLMEEFLNQFGVISIIGCRIEVRKVARKYNLELPDIFK